MRFFNKKMGREEKKLFERKFLLAQEKPDEVFDLINCGLQTVAPKVFSLFRVLHKEILLLQHNRIQNLKDVKFEDLVALKVLDLSYNEIAVLPNQIQVLTKLVKLDLSFNKLKELPDGIGSLKSLQVLNVRANRLSNLPASIKNLQELRTLDICDNKDLYNLPVNLCFLRNLEDFVYDKEKIRYPPKEVSVKGIDEIRRWLMLIKGEEYAEELAILNAKCLSVSDGKKVQLTDPCDSQNAAFEDAISRREKEREAKKQQQLDLEKRIMEAQTENAILLSAAAKDRQQVLANAAFEEMKAQAELHRVYEENEGNRTKLFQNLRHHEDSLNETVQLVLQFAEKSRHTEQLLEELEADREKMEQLFKVTQEEAENLRKQEVINSMTMVMEELEKHQRQFHAYEMSRDNAASLALRSFVDSNQDVESLLAEREAERADLLQKVSTEEEAQIEAFRVLQHQKDAKLGRIRQQIDMIQSELLKISMLEQQRRQEQEEEEMNRLADMRINTAMLLSQLIDEQEKREHELVERLKEMENYKEDQAKDYWLIQFQRLLDSKPQVLIDEENQLDVYVADILVDSGTKEYLPMFARKKVTREQMNEMTSEQLKEIGVKDEKARNSILVTIRSHILMDEKATEKSFKRAQSVAQDEGTQEVAASAPSIEGIVARYEQECVVCLDQPPDMIFLNCGHLCTCAICAIPLNQCPLCRQEIVQKCRLYGRQ